MKAHNTSDQPDRRNMVSRPYTGMNSSIHNGTHVLPSHIAQQTILHHPNIPQPSSASSRPRPTRAHPPTSSVPQQRVTTSLPPRRHMPDQPYPPALPPVHQLTASRHGYSQNRQQNRQQQQPSSTLPAAKSQPPPQTIPAPKPQLQQQLQPPPQPQTIPPRPQSNGHQPGRILHTLLPPTYHTIRPNVPIRPFILSLPLGTPFHKRYKAILRFTRAHGDKILDVFTSGPYFSYRDPANNQIHFLINDILVPDGRWSEELSYEVQVIESGLGVLDRDKKTWGNHWREGEGEKEGVVKFEGKGERGVKLFWYGEGVELEEWEKGEEWGEEERRVFEGVYGWVC
ncbi:hypothetical protein QBC41DRAFT_390736 [Cercophora samala]|uniref:Uncharacterized protein n=1 Tax=Cercophora samala TaxID=330535 RepID=A0AA40DB47_9PEZI|nr:hypothetical protein QBC41DRAFT_390736 [Cercophora samala]